MALCLMPASERPKQRREWWDVSENGRPVALFVDEKTADAFVVQMKKVRKRHEAYRHQNR